jgi:serine/threonine protein kinase
VEGTPFGRYRLLDLVGRGGMGEVWRAFDTVTERIVALKVLPAQFADDATFQERFRREARASAALDEPHIVPIHDFGEIDGKLYVTMRLINGRDLHDVLADGRLPPGRAVGIIDQIASALQAAHRVGLVHRDVKPSNILIADDDFAYLIDFGIARATGQTALTNTSSVMGTCAYMAPERLTTAESDARADTYALACVLYQCLTGSQPFPGDSLEQQIGGHITMPPPAASHRHRDVPQQLDAVIAKGMAKNPHDRYPTTREMAQAAKAAVAYPSMVPNPLPSTPPAYFGNAHPHRYPQQMAQQTAYYADNHVVTPGYPPPAGPTRYSPTPNGHAHYPPQYPPQYPPPYPQYPPGPHGPKQLRAKASRKGLLIALGCVAAVVAIVAAIILVNYGDTNTHSTASHNSTAPAATNGPFTGTFTVQFGPTTRWNGEPWPTPGPAYTETWRLRSTCTGNDCVATASAGDQYPSKSLIFDQIGEQWIAITTSQGKCKDASGELWNALILQPGADGSMSGEFTQTQQNGCLSKRTVTFRRTGDVSAGSLPDPATLSARVTTPADALHGRYHEVLKLHKVHEFENGVRSDCLRDGTRCMSYFVDLATGSGEALIFENGKWSRNSVYDADCTSGGRDHITNTGTFPLPQPAQDPIQVLTGRGRIHIAPGGTSTCQSVDYDQTFTRTGD